jgi:CRP-like cAMP-binding protein
MYKLHFEKGDTIFNNGDEANAFYIIGYGKV